MWEVAKLKVCPCCGFARERGHWARVDVTHSLESVERLGGVPDPREALPTLEALQTPVVPASREQEPRAIWEAKSVAGWLVGIELRLWRERLRARALRHVRLANAMRVPEAKLGAFLG